jgi:chromosome segregation ATPase
MDPDTLWHSLAGGAIIAAALTFARQLLDYGLRGGEQRLDRVERQRRVQRDAEARLERILQDRLAEADRRLDRCEQDLHAERMRSAAFEHEHARLVHAHNVLKEQYAALQADHMRLAQRAPR